jgi:hypothetical protein
MTITLKPPATLGLVAVLAVLVGFAVGQIAGANSSPRATAASAQVRQLKQINKKLGVANGSLDQTKQSAGRIELGLGDANFMLGVIAHNSGAICQANSGTGCQGFD